jgi:carbon monoxide dehydrogenase subunit G
MLQFAGTKDFSLSPDDLIRRLGDARFLVECIPGVEAAPQSEPNRAFFKLRPGFSFVRGTLDITITVTEVVPGSALHYHVYGKGIGSSNTVEADLQASPREGGCRVEWRIAITELGGLLKAVPQGLIQGAAQKAIEDIWAKVAARLGGA